jgi:hypothetical protein
MSKAMAHISTRALGIGPCTVVTSLALMFAALSARAQSEPHPTAVPPALSASAAEAGAAGGLHAGWLQRRAAALSSLRVIELPDESPPGARARRPHHALTWRNDTLSRSLDELGLTNAECRNRVRLPSRLRQSPGGGAAVQVQLQVALSCSF